jgi:nickel-dependent lactate racemase
MIVELKDKDSYIELSEATEAIKRFFAEHDYADKRILLLVPDNTRSGPIGQIFKIIYECIAHKTNALDVLIALGTHPPMTEGQICRRLTITTEERKTKYSQASFLNHNWQNPKTFTSIGNITADVVAQISNGLFREDVDVAINKAIFDYDEIFIIGPVFPHEVVGFSGGHKYIFPGIAGAEIINFFHWLGAVITNPVINGTKITATRQIVEKAASFIKVPRTLFAIVALEDKLKGLFIGDVFEAWEKAADLSEQIHLIYKDKPYKTVLGLTPEMYDDLWTAGKVMYKLEPILADGATLIIHAPHITEISYTHGKIIDQVGYHTKDYFLKQWDRFKHFPWGVLAHSTHVKGIGIYENGIEKPRVNVVLATGISKERCQKVNLGYMSLDQIEISDYCNKEDKGILVVDHAGEMLYRLKDTPATGFPTELKDTN